MEIAYFVARGRSAARAPRARPSLHRELQITVTLMALVLTILGVLGVPLMTPLGHQKMTGANQKKFRREGRVSMG